MGSEWTETIPDMSLAEVIPDPSCDAGKEADRLGYVTAIGEKHSIQVPIGTKVSVAKTHKTGSLFCLWQSGQNLDDFEMGYFHRWQLKYAPSRNP
jgi:hypothetical protein